MSAPLMCTGGVSEQFHLTEARGEPHAPATLSQTKSRTSRWTSCWERLEEVLGVLKKKMALSCTGIRTPDRPAHSLVTVPTELPQDKKDVENAGKISVILLSTAAPCALCVVTGDCSYGEVCCTEFDRNRQKKT